METTLPAVSHTTPSSRSQSLGDSQFVLGLVVVLKDRPSRIFVNAYPAIIMVQVL